jgi:16S rRNA (guanine1207-N2)-methyltransferase
MAHHDFDPAVKLLLTADSDTGKRALLILAGTGELAAGIAPRFDEAVCHNADCAKHAAALDAVKRLRLGNVRCLLGDLPCAEGGDEGGLAGPRFPPGHFDLIAFRLGKGTAQLNAVLTESFRLLAPGGHLLVSGHNQEGIKSFAKRGEAHFGNIALEGIKSSCRLLRFRKDGAAPAEAVEDPGYFKPVNLELDVPGGNRIGYITKPGIFAYRATDPGTALLAAHLPPCSGKKVMDLGCGSGALSLAAFKLGAASVLATDNSAIAIACAEANFAAQAPSGTTLCADMAEGAPEDFDLILANPPFHRDSETDYGLPERVVRAVFKHLKPGGEAYLVANQFLDYSTPSKKLFQQAAILDRAHGYTIHHMVKAV